LSKIRAKYLKICAKFLKNQAKFLKIWRNSLKIRAKITFNDVCLQKLVPTTYAEKYVKAFFMGGHIKKRSL